MHHIHMSTGFAFVLATMFCFIFAAILAFIVSLKRTKAMAKLAEGREFLAMKQQHQAREDYTPYRASAVAPTYAASAPVERLTQPTYVAPAAAPVYPSHYPSNDGFLTGLLVGDMLGHHSHDTLVVHDAPTHQHSSSYDSSPSYSSGGDSGFSYSDSGSSSSFDSGSSGGFDASF